LREQKLVRTAVFCGQNNKIKVILYFETITLSPAERELMEDPKQLLKHQHYNTWQLIKLYWQSEQRHAAYFFMVVVLIMTILLVALDVIFNYWYNYFYDALQAYNKSATLRLLGVFVVLATINIIFAVYRFYLSQLFAVRWRRWLTSQFIDRWLSDRSYYYLENFDVKTDNPDQRIQEDVGGIITNTIDLTIGLVSSIASFFAFLYILWTLSGNFHIDFGSWGKLHIPGYLVWVSLIYSILGTFLTFKIGRPLVALNFEQQRREANFRFAAIDLRNHAEHVALYRGESHQKGILHYLFGNVLDNWYFIIMRQKMLLWFTAGYNQAAVLLPLAAALPNYFEKVFLLGGLMQTLNAFANVQSALSYFVASYNQIAVWQATSRRLTTFVNHMSEADKQAEQENKLTVTKHDAHTIEMKDVSIETPRGEPLLNHINQVFKHGQHYLIKGPSGIGKSTLVRTLAGIWPYASGELVMPKTHDVFATKTLYADWDIGRGNFIS
jgi:vitamin B12/bleomycin/antimicrobial peptide transport system ATP-binding/permease protein